MLVQYKKSSSFTLMVLLKSDKYQKNSGLFAYLRKKHYLCARIRGKLSEWSKEPHSKCGIRASVSRVRIPHFPQNNEKSVCPNLFEQADFSLFCKDAVGRLRDYVAIPTLRMPSAKSKPLLLLLWQGSSHLGNRLRGDALSSALELVSRHGQ